jgi:hypothetical protein
MTSPLFRRSTAVTAGALVLSGLLAAPVAAFAAEPTGSGAFGSAVDITPDTDGAGDLYTLTGDVSTYSTITLPDDATLNGNGHTITAVEDADHRNFSGSVLASAVGTASAPARLDVRNLDIDTHGFEGGSNSNGLLNGIYMNRAGGSLTNVSVNGISHGNGVQEGNAISIRNRVSGDNIDVPRAQVTLSDIDVTNFQKTGLLLDGNLGFTVTNAHVGQGAGPQGQPNPTIAANSLQISRGASGTVTNSTLKLNSHEEGTAALLYSARTVDFDNVNIDGDAQAMTGVSVSNASNTIDTTFTMRDGTVARTATPPAGTGLRIEGPADSISARTIDTRFTGWGSAVDGNVSTTTTTTTTPPAAAQAVTKVDVTGTHQASRPKSRRLRIDVRASKLGAQQVEGRRLVWTIKVDGHWNATIRQHAGDADVWAHSFRKHTGTHTVQILKGGVSQHTYKVSTR